MPETKYTTKLYLAVKGDSAETAGNNAICVYQDFLGRLRRSAPTVTNMRLVIEEPKPRKGSEGVFELWSDLKAMVSDELPTAAVGAVIPAGPRDAWRNILKTTFNASMHHNHELVYHTSSRVEITREVLPEEEAAETAPNAPVETKPKELIGVKVLLGGKEFNVEIPKGENLLDGVNDKGIDVKWDCKSGVCDTCQVKVLSGMENLSPPNDNEHNILGDKVKQGYRLSCQITASGPCQIQQ